MKWICDGFALTPKQCDQCHKHFIFERYRKLPHLRLDLEGGKYYTYLCHDCYKELWPGDIKIGCISK